MGLKKFLLVLIFFLLFFRPDRFWPLLDEICALGLFYFSFYFGLIGFGHYYFNFWLHIGSFDARMKFMCVCVCVCVCL